MPAFRIETQYDITNSLILAPEFATDWYGETDSTERGRSTRPFLAGSSGALAARPRVLALLDGARPFA